MRVTCAITRCWRQTASYECKRSYQSMSFLTWSQTNKKLLFVSNLEVRISSESDASIRQTCRMVPNSKKKGGRGMANKSESKGKVDSQGHLVCSSSQFIALTSKALWLLCFSCLWRRLFNSRRSRGCECLPQIVALGGEYRMKMKVVSCHVEQYSNPVGSNISLHEFKLDEAHTIRRTHTH